jgi:glycyl-tRNA synthetase
MRARAGAGTPRPGPSAQGRPPDKELNVATRLENVISLTKRRGFVYPCGEIYGGTRAAWDYGPFGVELKENIKRQWWKSVV